MTDSRILRIPTKRDVRLLRLNQRDVLVVSCDSSGSIGSKPLDQIKCSPYTVGKFATRVALMEVLAVDAVPICIAAPLAVEPTPTGKEILKGITSEVRKAGLDPQTPIVESTEKNFKVKQTGAGVTVIGLARSKSLRVGQCVPGDEVFMVGLPCVGAQVLSGERHHVIADTMDVRNFVDAGFVHEVIPVGSRGIIHEANVIAQDSNLRFKPDRQERIDLTKSAGPGTAILIACSKRRRKLQSPKPITLTGTLI